MVKRPAASRVRVAPSAQLRRLARTENALTRRKSRRNLGIWQAYAWIGPFCRKPLVSIFGAARNAPKWDKWRDSPPPKPAYVIARGQPAVFALANKTGGVQAMRLLGPAIPDHRATGVGTWFHVL